jgi:hypothetical protein
LKKYRSNFVHELFKMPEFWLFFVYPIVAFLGMLLFPRFDFAEVFSGIGGVRGPLFFLLAGPPELKFLLLLLIFYVPWRSIEEGLAAPRRGLASGFQFFATAIVVYGGICAVNIANALALTYLSRQDPDRVKRISMFLMEVDRAVFGCYPVFEIHRMLPRFIGAVSIQAYLLFSSLGLVTFLATLVRGMYAARRFNCAMVAWTVLALPCWAFVPAVSPEELFRQGVLGDMPGMEAVTVSLRQLTIIPELDALLKKLSTVWSNPSQGIYAVSSFPSFHVGGYLIIAYGLFLVHRYTLVVMIPLCVLNVCGALYSFQHYVVDFVPAVAIALVTIYGAEKWCPDEESPGSIPDIVLHPIACVAADGRRLMAWVMRVFPHFRDRGHG